MDPATLTFDRLRPRLQGIAYRMLGSVAEEVVQDAWLRWHHVRQEALDSAEAWRVTVTTRLSIDRCLGSIDNWSTTAVNVRIGTDGRAAPVNDGTSCAACHVSMPRTI
jgi:DNA-directed RNA polymerase specialized sigma24 family protein